MFSLVFPPPHLLVFTSSGGTMANPFRTASEIIGKDMIIFVNLHIFYKIKHGKSAF